MKRVIVILSIIALILINFSCANENTVELDESYAIVKDAKLFVHGGITFDGHHTDELIAFAKLYRSKNAKNYFIKLEKEGTNAGKLYALSGLYYLDKKMYNELEKKYATSEEPVRYASGCLFRNTTIGDMVRDEYSDEFPMQLVRYIESTHMSPLY